LQRARGELRSVNTLSAHSLHSLGLAVFQVIKAGFVFSGKAGSGLVIARLPDGSWSAPSCIATGGVGWGLQVGADITDFVIVLNSEDAVRAFSLGGNMTIGGNVSASAGPIGTGGSVQASLAHPAPMFSYSKSKGENQHYLMFIVLITVYQVCSPAFP
jgi:SH3 domain-containing YSC84-like protein 1